MQIHVLAPNLFGFKGGVQVYSAFLLQALQRLYPSFDYTVFLKYEQSISHNLRALQFLPTTQFHCFGEKVYNANAWSRRWQTGYSATTILASALWQRPQLTILTELSSYVLLCHYLKRFMNRPYWVVLHGLEAWNLQDAAYLAALRNADRIIAVSHYTRDRILSEGYLNPAKVAVLPNTFDAKEFQIQPKPTYLLERYALSADQPIILTVSRLQKFAKYKGYDKVLQALPQVRQQIPDVRYLLAGKGDDFPRLQAMVSKLGIEDCVTFTGFIPEHELGDHYNLCDVFAMPSKGEGFGIVYLEALACGKPVLAGNQDGAVDPLVNGQLGCLVNPDDVEAIAHYLIQILQGTYPNPLLYQPECLRQEVMQRFEFKQFCQTLGQLKLIQ
jgi:glycosyltransferase involved in cell wall biosynthesis